MTICIINYGAGDIYGIYCRQKIADKNIRLFRKELGISGVKIKYIKNSKRGGRYDFRLSNGKKSVIVSMPGINKGRVIYKRNRNNNVWNFYRLFVNGDSWLWEYALSVVKEELK